MLRHPLFLSVVLPWSGRADWATYLSGDRRATAGLAEGCDSSRVGLGGTENARSCIRESREDVISGRCPRGPPEPQHHQDRSGRRRAPVAPRSPRWAIRGGAARSDPGGRSAATVKAGPAGLRQSRRRTHPLPARLDLVERLLGCVVDDDLTCSHRCQTLFHPVLPLSTEELRIEAPEEGKAG
jgi:hypothetical protein